MGFREIQSDSNYLADSLRSRQVGDYAEFQITSKLKDMTLLKQTDDCWIGWWWKLKSIDGAKGLVVNHINYKYGIYLNGICRSTVYCIAQIVQSSAAHISQEYRGSTQVFVPVWRISIMLKRAPAVCLGQGIAALSTLLECNTTLDVLPLHRTNRASPSCT